MMGKAFGLLVHAVKFFFPVLLYLGGLALAHKQFPSRPDLAVALSGLIPVLVAFGDWIYWKWYNRSHFVQVQINLLFNLAVSIYTISDAVGPGFTANGLALWRYSSTATNWPAFATSLLAAFYSFFIFLLVSPPTHFAVRKFLLERGLVKLKESGTNNQGSARWMRHHESMLEYGRPFGYVIGAWDYQGVFAKAFRSTKEQYEAEQKFDAAGERVGTIVPDLGSPFLRYPCGKGGVLICAATRTGKGRCLITTNLCDRHTWKRNQPAAFFVVDVKGELVEASWKARWDMGRKVRVWDPFGLTKGTGAPKTCVYDPFLDMVDPEVRTMMVDALAEAMFPESKDEKAHFREIPLAAIKAIVWHVLEDPSYDDKPHLRNLFEVSRLLSLPPPDFKTFCAELRNSPVGNGAAGKAIGMLLDAAAEEYGSHMTSAKRALTWINGKEVQSTLSLDLANKNLGPDGHSGPFSLRELVEGDTDFYLVLPEGQMGEQGRFMRMLIQELLILTANPKYLPKRNLAMVIDEAYQLKKLPALQSAFGICAGRNLTIFFVLQNRGQGIELYGKEGMETIEAGSSLKIFFGFNSYDNSELVSKELGKKTILVENESMSSGASGQRSGLMGSGGNVGRSVAYSEVSKPLLDPNELLVLGNELGIAIARGQRPLLFRKIQVDKVECYRGWYARPRNLDQNKDVPDVGTELKIGVRNPSAHNVQNPPAASGSAGPAASAGAPEGGQGPAGARLGSAARDAAVSEEAAAKLVALRGRAMKNGAAVRKDAPAEGSPAPVGALEPAAPPVRPPSAPREGGAAGLGGPTQAASSKEAPVLPKAASNPDGWAAKLRSAPGTLGGGKK